MTLPVHEITFESQQTVQVDPVPDKLSDVNELNVRKIDRKHRYLDFIECERTGSRVLAPEAKLSWR
jgi:hypothetical protein